MSQTTLRTAARLIANAEPQMLGDYRVSLKVPTQLRRGERVLPHLQFEIHAGFSQSVAELYDAKLKNGYLLTPPDRALLAGSIRNYREILKAIFLTLGKPKSPEDPDTRTLAINFSKGIA